MSNAANDSWVNPIGDHWTFLNDGYQRITDMAIAADGDDLVVTWIQEGYDEQEQELFADIWGYTIADASTRSGTEPGFESGGANLGPINRNIAYGIQFESSVHTDWDPDISKLRIVRTEYDSNIGKFKTSAGQILLYQNGQPYSIDQLYQISNDSHGSTHIPSIAVNRMKQEWKNLGDYFEAFSSFSCTEGSYLTRIDKAELQSDEGNDQWQLPDDPITTWPTELDTCITYRPFGDSRNIWIKSDVVETNSEILAENRSPKSVKITTNRHNQIDSFASYTQDTYSDRKIMIQQLEP